MTTPSRLPSALALRLSRVACGGDGAPAGEPPVVPLQPVAVAVGIGERATFLVRATGTEPSTYQWRRHGVGVPGATPAGPETAAAGSTTPQVTMADAGRRSAWWSATASPRGPATRRGSS